MIRVHLFISKNNFLNIQEWRLCSEEHVLESYTLKRASIWRQTVVVCACRHFVLNFWRPLRLCWRKHKLSQNSSKIRVYRDFLHNLLMWSTIQKKKKISICCDLKKLSEGRHHSSLLGCVTLMTQSLKPIKNKNCLEALCKNAGDTVQSYWRMVNSESWFPKPCLACLCSPEGGESAWIRVCRKPHGGSAVPRCCEASLGTGEAKPCTPSWFEVRTWNTYFWQGDLVMHFKD